jgi:NTP pyrophosphatase (non-canonical NTP hydrolase)
MLISEVTDFVGKVHEKLVEKHSDLDLMQRQLCMYTKLSEEVGELSRAVLGYYDRQRQEEDRDPIGEIWPECADVIFAAMMVATSFGIDIEEEMRKKKEKIEGRFGI